MTIKTDPAQCRVFRTRALETGIKERTFKFERAQETNEENRTMRISVGFHLGCLPRDLLGNYGSFTGIHPCRPNSRSL